MKELSLIFWSLVFVTAGVSYRWGAMFGLVVFVVLLMVDAVMASRWSLR